MFEFSQVGESVSNNGKNKARLVIRRVTEVEVIPEKLSESYFLLGLYFHKNTTLETLKLLYISQSNGQLFCYFS